MGAGGAGTCAALELTNRGYTVDLFEKASEPISKASFVNEGKIHLGFIYAMDRGLRTAKHMIQGSLHFMSSLKRWININPEDVLSTPFHYCIHRGSHMNSEELLGHYKQCAAFFDECSKFYRKKYLDLFDVAYVKLLSPSKVESIANPEYIEAVFETNEHAIEPRTVARKLREALLSQPHINLQLNTTVKSVARDGCKLVVHARTNDHVTVREKYDQVVNVTWDGMPEIDRTMKIEPVSNWCFRYKFGSKILIRLSKTQVPSCTMVQGPFGDIVNFKDKGFYLSWYPIGRTGWSEAYSPPEWDALLSASERADVFKRSFDQMMLRIPAMKNLDFSHDDISPVGGVIYALGSQDVDDEKSKLHTRHELGIRSFDGYHTVNTGKYTLVPYTGLQIADRIEGKA